jgi:hypothetical protein
MAMMPITGISHNLSNAMQMWHTSAIYALQEEGLAGVFAEPSDLSKGFRLQRRTNRLLFMSYAHI